MLQEGNEQEYLYFNGVDGESGGYDLPPMTSAELTGFIQGEGNPENLSELRFRYQQRTTEHLGIKEGVDPKKLDQSGWGIIFAHNADPAVKEALSPLIDLRQAQAGNYFHLFEGPDGYRTGESKGNFLARHGTGPGPADPEKVPYYLLIVGDPETIPFRFQSQLDVQYAVGRIHFDTLEAYDNYARSVVATETGQVKLPRQAAFFGVGNPDDKATELSSKYLVQSLLETSITDKPDWTFSSFINDQATKAQLARLLGGDQTPVVLFSASHGMSFPLGSQHQRPHQGALLCQDWPGPQQWRGQAIPQDFYFAGDDLTDGSNLLGLIAFFFACFSGGTPQQDEFARQAFRQRTAIAPHAFLAQLPTRMLSHPRGGALAVIGHVERAWGYSFVWPGAGAQTTVFESAWKRLLEGHPVGSAIEHFNERYAELSTELSVELEKIEWDEKAADPYELAGMWTANNDARGYAIIGDPAVRLPLVKDGEAELDRPVIALSENGSPAAPTVEKDALHG